MRPPRALVVVLAAAGLAGCAPEARALISNGALGSPIISFPSSEDHVETTVVLSNPKAQQAGVDGRTLDIVTFRGARAIADNLTIDGNGNVGIRGALSTRSSRSVKTDVRRFDERAIDVLARTTIVTYHFKGEPSSAARHIGFIAEDTPAELSGPRRDAFEINNSVALTIEAERELEAQYRSLRDEVRDLRRELRDAKRVANTTPVKN